MEKTEARRLVRETFEQRFDKTRFYRFVRELLNQFEDAPFVNSGNIIPDAYKPFFSSLERIGKYQDIDGKKIDILVVKLKRGPAVERARATQRNYIARYLNGSRGGDLKDAALVAFVADDSPDWRFSLVKMDYKFIEGEAGSKLEEEITAARRFSFLVGENEASHTAQTRLEPIVRDDINNPTLAELEEAFNIETVTKEFFNKYRELFIRTKEELDKVLKREPKAKEDFKGKDVDTVNFAKKLLGQIIFLYFLQKKGWFGVPRDAAWGAGSKFFLRELYEKKQGDYSNYFNDILEPLFYEALRIDRSHDDHYYSHFDCKIPFLNGGLFDPINNYDWVHTDILLPNVLFSNNNKTKEGDSGDGILDIFDRYNFTVKEDEPFEKEVAIDPELLGKAYEKFNAIRPDNYADYLKALKSGKKGEESKFNKQYGVYYTPREIVHYMCQQSLINYLHSELNQNAVYQALSDDRLDMFGKAAKKGQMEKTVEHPIAAIPKDDIETLILRGEQIKEHDARVIDEERETRNYSFRMPESIRKAASQIDQKLASIKICDPAVGSGAFPVGVMSEIARARDVLKAWTKTDKTAYDFKRECIENSLYGVDIDSGAVEIAKLRLWLSLVVDEDDPKNIKPLPNLDYKVVCGDSLVGFPENWGSPLEKEIETLIHQHVNETNPSTKSELKRKIDAKIQSRYANSLRLFGYQVNFDFRTVFSEIFQTRGGFDIVIGNPPYINIEHIPKKSRQYLLSTYGENGKLGKRYDIYQVFVLKGIKILADQGVLSFILPNTFLMGHSYQIMRKRIIENSLVLECVDLPQGVFESATVDNVIILLQREIDRDIRTLHSINVYKLKPKSQLSRIISGDWDEAFRIPQTEITVGTEYKINIHINHLQKMIFSKMEAVSVELGEITESSQGIILYKTEEDAIKSKYTGFVYKKGWKKLLRGKNIGQYLVHWTGEYVKYGSWLWSQRDEKYFIRPKLLLQAIRNKSLSKRLIATYDEDNYYNAHNLANIIAKEGSPYNLKYILGLFNSNLLNYWYKAHFPNVNINPNDFRKLPIRIIGEKPEMQKKIGKIVNQIMATKHMNPRADTSGLEKEIDRLVYQLYGLTEEEIKIVEGKA